jgi:hypothetical protein
VFFGWRRKRSFKTHTVVASIGNFYFQTANSPYTNINGLGFFVSIQALQFQHPSANIGELIARVLQLYETYPHAKLNNVF